MLKLLIIHALPPAPKENPLLSSSRSVNASRPPSGCKALMRANGSYFLAAPSAVPRALPVHPRDRSGSVLGGGGGDSCHLHLTGLGASPDLPPPVPHGRAVQPLSIRSSGDSSHSVAAYDLANGVTVNTSGCPLGLLGRLDNGKCRERLSETLLLTAACCRWGLEVLTRRGPPRVFPDGNI